MVNPMRSNLNLRVFWKPVNPQDCVWENLYRIFMKTTLQEKETIHCSIIIWLTSLCPCLKLWKFQQQKQQWTRNGKNWIRFRRGTWQKSEVRKRSSMKQGRRAQKFISPHWWTYVTWKMLNWRQSTKNTKVELHSEVILWKMILDLMQYSLNKDYSASQMTAAEIMDIISRLPGCAGQAADAVSAYTQVKMEDAPKILKIPESECPDVWIHLPRHKCPKSWSNMEDPVVPLGHPLAGLLWERQFEKILLQHGWEKVSNWECFFLHREKRIILICECGWHQIDWKETKYQSDVESTQQRSRFARTNIFPWSWKLGMHSKTMWNKQRYCGQLQSHVWIENISWENWKTSILWEFSSLVWWEVTTRKAVRKTI